MAKEFRPVFVAVIRWVVQRCRGDILRAYSPGKPAKPTDTLARSNDSERSSGPNEHALCAVDERSGATIIVSEIRCGGVGVDRGTLFASLGIDAAKTGTASVRTKSCGGAEMVGGRILGHSRVGQGGEGANSLVR